ncbi:NYN domain-containing protein [Aestuariivirga sp.]|uniref:NYN domain-containing protein n=1 Tax=Aestuariivirga sp. TaxID=2650926 RepID=UPI0039E2D5D8
MPQNPRAILYVDGFNLYHPIQRLGASHLKWLDLTALGRLICQDRGHELVGVTYCTAYQRNDPNRLARHKKYIQALESTGLVETVLGHYMEQETDACRHCGIVGTKETEKQTDINLALSVFSDAMHDRFDWAYLLSADSDQAATARFLRDHFEGKSSCYCCPAWKRYLHKHCQLCRGKAKVDKRRP